MFETNKMQILRSSRLWEVIRFGLVGTLVTAIHYVVYWLFKRWMDYSLAFAIGYGLSFVVNYVLTSYFTFRCKASLKNGIGFGGAHLFNFILQTLLLRFFVWMGFTPTLAPIPVYLISIPTNFLMVRFVFKGRGKKRNINEVL